MSYQLPIDDIVCVLHERTTNDVNGNPRRCFTAINAHGHIVAVSDEGYEGEPSWARALRNERSLFAVDVIVTPRHYRDRIKMGRRLEQSRSDER